MLRPRRPTDVMCEFIPLCRCVQTEANLLHEDFEDCSDLCFTYPSKCSGSDVNLILWYKCKQDPEESRLAGDLRWCSFLPLQVFFAVAQDAEFIWNWQSFLQVCETLKVQQHEAERRNVSFCSIIIEDEFRRLLFSCWVVYFHYPKCFPHCSPAILFKVTVCLTRMKVSERDQRYKHNLVDGCQWFLGQFKSAVESFCPGSVCDVSCRDAFYRSPTKHWWELGTGLEPSSVSFRSRASSFRCKYLLRCDLCFPPSWRFYLLLMEHLQFVFSSFWSFIISVNKKKLEKLDEIRKWHKEKLLVHWRLTATF